MWFRERGGEGGRGRERGEGGRGRERGEREGEGERERGETEGMSICTHVSVLVLWFCCVLCNAA